jgi:hypothetical protein
VNGAPHNERVQQSRGYGLCHGARLCYRFVRWRSRARMGAQLTRNALCILQATGRLEAIGIAND